LTSEWLRSALAEHFPDASPTLTSTERIGQGFGMSSVLVRCRLVGLRGRRSIIAKLWSTDGPAGVHEVPFYASLAQNLGIRVPVCHYGAIDQERRRGVLLLEDLEHAVQGDCLLQLDTGGAAALAGVIAMLHATWWQAPRLRAAGWLPSVVWRETEWLLSRRELFLHRFGDRIDSTVRRLLERAEAVQSRAHERLAGAAMTLLHGDLHLDNVVFDGGPEHPVLLDWARVAQGPAALDLGELLFEIAPIAELDRILGIYLGELQRGGITEVDEKSLRHQLGGALLRKVLRATCGVARWQPATDREPEMIELGLQRIMRAVQTWRRQDPELFRL
jgi:hypothetical protein